MARPGVYELRDIKCDYNTAGEMRILCTHFEETECIPTFSVFVSASFLFTCQGMTFGFIPFVNWTTFFCPEEAYVDHGRGPVMLDLCPSISTTISTMGIVSATTCTNTQYCGRTLSAIPFHSFLLQPVYLWILSSCLMTISFLFALTNWTVIILAITKNNTK